MVTDMAGYKKAIELYAESIEDSFDQYVDNQGNMKENETVNFISKLFDKGITFVLHDLEREITARDAVNSGNC